MDVLPLKSHFSIKKFYFVTSLHWLLGSGSGLPTRLFLPWLMSPTHEAPSVYTALCSMRHCLTLQGPVISKEKDRPTLAGELVKVDRWAGEFTQLSFRLMKCVDKAIWIQGQSFSDGIQTPQTASPADTKSEVGHQPPSCGAHVLMTLLLSSATQRTVCVHHHIIWSWPQPPGSGVVGYPQWQWFIHHV